MTHIHNCNNVWNSDIHITFNFTFMCQNHIMAGPARGRFGSDMPMVSLKLMAGAAKCANDGVNY